MFLRRIRAIEDYCFVKPLIEISGFHQFSSNASKRSKAQTHLQKRDLGENKIKLKKNKLNQPRLGFSFWVFITPS